MPKPLLLVVEDDRAVRNLITTTLETQDYQYHTAENGTQAILEAASQRPDILLLDLGLPDMDGVAVLKKIREWSAVPVIVVSSRQQEQDKVRALENGADDYVQKPFSTQELLARIRVALRHSRNSGTNLSIARDSRFEVGGLVIDYAKYRVYVDGNDVELTQNEYRLVALLGQYAGTVLTYADLIRRMWGPNAKQDNQILRVNMANIRRKIEKDPAHPRYIFTETGISYRMADK